ncbi:MAG: beta-ketoacyl-[acyl-carrier-protein] synthase family protein [Thermodesulfovibrionales bacterium]
MDRREVVITGMGLTTPLGSTVPENWANMKALKTGLAHYPKTGLPAFMEYLGKISRVSVPADIPPKIAGQMKFLSRGSLLGFIAAAEAAAQACYAAAAVAAGRRALYIASGDFTKVGYDFLYPAVKDASQHNWKELDHAKLNDAALSKVNPFFLLESLLNNLFSFLSAFLESMGPSTSVASLSPCGGYAIELACRSIRQNRADIAVAVGCGNWITEIPLYEIDGLGIASQCRDGVGSFRPFDRKRDGFMTGEGGAALVLEAAESAKKRGAPVFGRIRGLGNCIEFVPGRGLTVPPMVSRRCMEIAMADAGMGFNDLGFITPHGSGTQKGDASELMSIARVLEDSKAAVPVSGMKAYTGHLGAASDIAEVIMGIAASREHIVPATLNFSEPDRSLPGLNISGAHQSSGKACFLSTSYGVGGQSSSVVVEVL